MYHPCNHPPSLSSNTDRHINTQVLFHKPFLYTLLLLHICLLYLLHCLPAHTISVLICTLHIILSFTWCVPLLYLGRYNTFCEVIVDGQKHGNLKTEVVKKTASPEWDEEFTV